MAVKINAPKGGSTSAGNSGNPSPTKPPKGNQNPIIRKGG